MKTIAEAFPNRKYKFFQSVSDVVLLAKTNKTKVFFYIKENEKEKRVDEKTIRSLFVPDVTRHPKNIAIRNRPFNYKDNHKLWVVLNRNKQAYQKEFTELKDENTKGTLENS